MSGLLPARVSQEAFDEVVKENMEDFEMSPPEAVEDAIKQFKVQGVNLDNLDLSVPTDENRAERSKFMAATELLDGVVDSDSGDVNLKTCGQPVEALKDALMTVSEFCGPDHANAKIYRSLLVTNAAIYTLMSFLGVEGDGSVELLEVVVKCLKTVIRESMELRDAFIAQARCCTLLEAHSNNANLVTHLLALIKVSCKGVENNKGYFMKADGAKRVMQAMKTYDGSDPNVLGEACFVVNVMCKFDDFRKEMSSAHENAKTFNLLGVIPALLRITDYSLKEENTRLAVAAMNGVRVLAVNDEIVQSIVACGLLKRVKVMLDKYLPDPMLCSAAIGVYRNVSGNDEIKTTLVKDGSLVQMLKAMKAHQDSVSIAEHGCGALAAMALRIPENVEKIMQEDGAGHLVVAMKRHPKAVLVQRQGCLAIRNIIARNQDFKETLLELGIEKVLKDAGRYQGAVDEAYAALRDLGFEASVTKFDGDTGKIVKTEMFGEKKANFNKSTLASNEIDQRIDENAKPANQCVRGGF